MRVIHNDVVFEGIGVDGKGMFLNLEDYYIYENLTDALPYCHYEDIQ